MGQFNWAHVALEAGMQQSIECHGNIFLVYS